MRSRVGKGDVLGWTPSLRIISLITLQIVSSDNVLYLDVQ